MRNKKAKQLRKIAKEIKPWEEYLPKDVHYINFGTTKDPDYKPIINTIKLSGKCGKFAYKQLKRIES